MKSDNNSQDRLKKIVYLLVFLVILFAGLWFAERMNIRLGALTSAEEKFVDNAQDRLDSISKQLNLRMVQIKRLGGKVSELEMAKAQIANDLKQLDEPADRMDEETLKKKLSYYLRLIGLKDQEIKKLRKENVALIARNDSLSRETKLLADGLSSVQKALRDSSVTFIEKQKELSERSKTLEVRNQELVEKVNVAAAMHAEGVNVYAISTRGKEYGMTNQKAKKIDKIRVIFHLQENTLTAKELKTIYLRIIEPTGMTISDYSLGSGSFLFKSRELVYTAKQRIFYENNHQSVEFIYARNGAYREGRHEIEIYSEGFLIGLGSFEVR